MKRGLKIGIFVFILLVFLIILFINYSSRNVKYCEFPQCYIDSTNQTCHSDTNCFYWFPKAKSVLNTCNLNTSKCEHLFINTTDEEYCLSIEGEWTKGTC